MNQLPTELFNEVFTYLHQKDKVECMLVCHQWKDTIESFTLFHTLRVTSLKSLELTTQKLKEDPNYGNQVERLSLLINKPSVNPTQLFLLLPNLRILYIYNFNMRLIIDQGIQLPFLNNIRCIVEHSRQSITRSLLSVSCFSKLTVLCIADFADTGITMLAHAPALVQLTLDLGYINFEGLEFIHENLPLLRIIRMISMDVGECEFYKEIKPAPLVRKCVFQYLEFTGDSEKFLLKYISKKYPNLSNFTYVNDVDMDDVDDARINTESWKPFFKTMGPKLKSVSIRQKKCLMDVVSIIDSSDCELKSLTLSSRTIGEDIYKLGKSDQIKYISSLTLEDIHCKTFEWIKELKVLRKLALVSCHLDEPLEIELTDILNMCNQPTFKKLGLQNVKLSFDDTEARPYNITELSLELATFSEGMDQFISKYLSQLSLLELMRCKLEGRTFNLSTSRLSHLHIDEDFIPSGQDILICTLSDNQKRWYTAERDGIYIGFHNDSDNNDIALYPPAKSLPADNIERFPFFTLLCHSVKNVLISNYPFSI
ncbi:hypothetical protein K501DRAFT_311663 [Backusella circina FSU 941]|nr:hypothetical protein K501DRAFT_311663 [Backusella circina FSU 941]